jgi:hypothetical protein
VDEDVESLNFQNLEGAYTVTRDSIIQNIASACGMPASIISHEAFNKGLAEGSEDAKKEAAYLDFVRQDMRHCYAWIDRIVMRKAWTEEFWKSLHADYPEIKRKPYETWLYECMRSFKATWPNLLEEPDSEKSKTAKVQMDAAIEAFQAIAELGDPESTADAAEWLAANMNERTELFASKLVIDVEALRARLNAKADQAEEAAEAALEPDDKGKKKPPDAAAA